MRVKEKRRGIGEGRGRKPQGEPRVRARRAFRAGLALLGTEVKSARDGKVNLKDSYAAPRGELYLMQSHINPYSHGTMRTTRRCGREAPSAQARLRKLIGKVTERGLTLIPTRMYFKNGRLKVEIALARGKRQHDRRAAEREKDVKRDVAAALKERNR
jgi:SsrA-binding protein